MSMRIGMRLDGWMTPQRCVSLAQAAEASDLDAIWFAENPFGRGVLPAMAACGVATRSIKIGAGVFNPFNRHPSLIAMEMGALEDLLPGRTNLGVGTGVERRLRQANIASEKPIAAMKDTILIVRALMAGETADYHGAVFSASGIKLEFPAPRPDYPIFLASMGDQSIQLAGRIADGIMISNLCTPGFTRRALDLIASNKRPRERPAPLRVVQYAPCVAGPDRHVARGFAKTVVGKMLIEAFGPASTPKSRQWHFIGSGIEESDFISVAGKLQAGEDATTWVRDEMLDLFAVAGDHDDVSAAIQRYTEAGVSDMVITFRGADPVEDMSYLRPLFRELNGR